MMTDKPVSCEHCGTIFVGGKPALRECCPKGKLTDIFVTGTPEEISRAMEEYLKQGGERFDLPRTHALYKGVAF
jgi:hypothetical protein